MKWTCRQCTDTEGKGMKCVLNTSSEEEPLYCPVNHEFDIAEWELKVDIKLRKQPT